ncbi:copper amine oxidase N-terminal domain-containing protein [Brevibacillus brevis]|uniref:copper amine oxidase N-terminal domain-containing protein n=1 Tax=Brevibacillus brevis TaxID=1393 RepID=UPI0037C70D90
MGRVNKSVGVKRGVVSVLLVGSLIMTGNAAFASDDLTVSKKAQVVPSAIQENNLITVIVDGAKESCNQPPIMQNGSVLVPMKALFEKLGAEVSYEAKTQVVTAVKGSTTIKLTLGKDVAYVNGQQVKLSVKAQSINGSTMVPLRFVGEALGAKVDWNAKTQTATIVSAKDQVQPPASGQVVNGIHVKYGAHTYGVKSQQEYDAAMKVVDAKIKSTDMSQYSTYDYYVRYVNGERWDGNRSNRSELNIGLFQAEQNIGALVKAGVSKDTILKSLKAVQASADLTNMRDNGLTDPKDGTPSSIYDTLFRKITDCDSDAQTWAAVFDSMGFNTMVLAGPGHADMLVQFNGTWYWAANGRFTPVNFATSYSGNGYVFTAPTTGPAPSW